MSNLIRKNAPRSLDVSSLHSAIDHISDYNSKIYYAARWYAQNGFHVIPFVTYAPGKVGYPKGLSQHHATTRLEKIDEWWHPKIGMCPGATIAMAMGGEAGYCALDLDVKAACSGIDTLSDLIYAYAEYGESGSEIDTLMASTPSGGRHLLFRYHPEIISNSEVNYAGIDTRGGLKNNPSRNGGIIFVEPSRKPGSDSKETYRWDESGPTQIIDFPQWLVEVLNGRPPRRGGVKLQDSYIESAPGEHGDGRNRNIYMDLMRFVGVGYTESQLVELIPDILERMDPPDERMVRRIIESVVQSEAYLKARNESERREKTDNLELDRNEKGQILKTSKNLTTILTSPIFEHEYGLIRYDDFYHHYTKNGEPLAMVADYSVGIQQWLSANLRLEFGLETIRKTMEYIAFTSDHVNAAKDYMLSQQRPETLGEENFWGSGRRGPGPAFQRLCNEVMDLSNPRLHKNYTRDHNKAYKAFLWFWLQGVVARACVPGCKMEIVLNIFGGQGIGKSTFFRDLCPDPAWFSDSLSDAVVAGGRDNKDELSKLQAKLIVEMPELSPIKRGGKAADDKMKQFISTQIDYFRRAYGTDTVPHPRTCALCGSSNNNDVYRDATGDRRFVSINHGDIPFNLGDHDNGVMDEIRDQLWAELVYSFSDGELDGHRNSVLVCIPPELRAFQKLINDEHRYEEIGLPEVLDWMEDKTRITWDEIKAYARTVPGLADAREMHIINIVRTALNNSGNWDFRKRCMRRNAEGNKEKTNYWLNIRHPLEEKISTGAEVPDHWSVYSEEREIQEY